jgi:AcrR family transcriptional regulator
VPGGPAGDPDGGWYRGASASRPGISTVNDVTTRSSPAPDSPPTGDASQRGEQTRRLIVDTAVRLFAEQGYDKTTMRAIAGQAGLSVSNAYYYFPSKDHLVQNFYAQILEEHRNAVAPELATQREFADRLLAALRTGVDTMRPYHALAGSFIKVAADPSSPLSPFSPESTPARERSLALFREVVDGATTKIDPELRADLPELLWLLHLGATLFWVYDRSPGQATTRMLVNRVVPLVDRLVGLSSMRVFRPVTREILALYRAVR